jgi:hypothetical protein
VLLSVVGLMATETVVQRRLAAQPIQDVTLCSLGSDWQSAEGKPLRLDTDVQFGIEGVSLEDLSCPESGYVLISDAGKMAEMEKLVDMRRTANTWRIHAVLEGHLYRPTLYRKLYERMRGYQTKPIPVFLANRVVSGKPIQ